MINLIPTPKIYHVSEDAVCMVNCSIYTESEDWEKCCDTFADMFYDLHEVKPIFAPGGIELGKNDNLAADSYTIDSEGIIRVCAADKEGVLYGLASLIQLIEVKSGRIEIPILHIEDYPDKEYRAFMVDLGREWHPYTKLMKYVDLCFLYKVKYLHLHFVDSKLYTLPSKTFPKLALPHKSYTHEQMEILNDYAKERGVILVPEFECPGHANVMIKKYPEVFGNHLAEDAISEFSNEFGNALGSESLMCAGSKTCFDGVKILLKEICELFPDTPNIHIGGDEANAGLWDYCDDCKMYMEANNIHGAQELYSEFVGRIAQYILSLGKTPMVWEGFPEMGADRIPKDTVVVVFESMYHRPDRLIEEGFQVINASWQPLYIVPPVDLRWGVQCILAWNVYNWQHWFHKSDAYLNPITVTPTDQVLGSMLCAWEQPFERELPFVMENLAAMCERSWTVKRVCSDEDFLAKLRMLLEKAARIIQDR